MSHVTAPPGSVADSRRIVDSIVRFPGGDGDEVSAYLAVDPWWSEPRAGVVVLHEAFGLNDHIRDVARRFANLGYCALAPDLYSREGAPDAADMQELLAKMFAVPDQRAVADLEAACAYLRARPDASGRLGVIGFCSGGRQTLLLASRSSAVDAAVDCWGGFVTSARPDAASTPERPVPVAELAGSITCPLYLAVGEQDDNPSPQDVDAVARRARDAGAPVTFRRFAGAGHAFFADYRESYEPTAAAQLWDDVVAFFASHLG